MIFMILLCFLRLYFIYNGKEFYNNLMIIMKKYPENYKHSEITEKIIKFAYYVYGALGSGFLEKIYENALCKKLKEQNLEIKQQYPINVYFENELIGAYFADILVENKVIIELKAIEKLHIVHEVQLVNYLKATKIEVGLLINFATEKLEIKRKVFSIKK